MEEIFYNGKDRIKRVKRNCLVCNKEIMANYYKILKGMNSFCSPSCRSSYRSFKYAKDNNIILTKNGRGEALVTRVCKVCLKEFQALYGNVKRGNGIYCSNACSCIGKIPKRGRALNYHLQAQAHNEVTKALKEGRLKRTGICSVCRKKETSYGKIQIEFDHDDYAKFLEVKELCRECHWEKHERQQREEDMQEV